MSAYRLSARDRWLALGCIGVSIVAAAVAAFGVFARGDGATIEVVSPRGERYDMATTGVYAFNAQRVVAEGVGWDVFTLAFAAPAMVLTALWLARGSQASRLAALGCLSYFFYQYLMYAVTWAMGPLFLPFVLIFGASLWLGAAIAKTLIDGEPLVFAPQFPRRAVAVLCVVLAVVLTAMWLGRIVSALRGDESSAMLLGQTTLVVQALDLGLIVPLALTTAVLTWRRRPLGYAMSTVFVVKAVAMASAICAMLIGAWRVSGTLEVPPLVFFGAAAVASGLLAMKMYRGAAAAR